MNFDISILANGHLQVAADAATLTALRDAQASGHSSAQILQDGTEHYWTNGRFKPFDAGAANPAVGLTDAPCIAEDMSYSDDGRAQIVGKLWWYPQYEWKDPIAVLAQNGKVFFQAAAQA